jgi:GrpB-like predicted nucleotidyltransferase (UPF0157 family)
VVRVAPHDRLARTGVIQGTIRGEKSTNDMKQPSEPAGHEPMTEEQLRATTAGELRVHGGPIQLVDYDPSWPEMFAREVERIAAALGEGALRTEHVGSTAVPGLAAKPIIDILLVVADSAAEEAYAPALEAAGYVLGVREPDWYEHRMFRDPDANVQVHVLSEGCPEIERMLPFRNRLRINHADRSSTSERNVSWPGRSGSSSRTTQVRRATWWRESSPGLALSHMAKAGRRGSKRAS